MRISFVMLAGAAGSPGRVNWRVPADGAKLKMEKMQANAGRKSELIQSLRFVTPSAVNHPQHRRGGRTLPMRAGREGRRNRNAKVGVSKPSLAARS